MLKAKLYIEKSNDPEEAKKTVAKRKAAREAGKSVRPKIESQNSFSEDEDEDDEEMVALAAAEQAYERAQHDALKKKISVAPIPKGFKSIIIKRPDQENIEKENIDKNKNHIDSTHTKINRTDSVKLSDGKVYNDVTIMKLYDKAYETCLNHGRDVNNLKIILKEFISPYKVPFTMHDLEIALTLKSKSEKKKIYGEGKSTKPANTTMNRNANRTANTTMNRNANRNATRNANRTANTNATINAYRTANTTMNRNANRTMNRTVNRNTPANRTVNRTVNRNESINEDTTRPAAATKRQRGIRIQRGKPLTKGVTLKTRKNRG
jgi:hypothetical protein